MFGSKAAVGVDIGSSTVKVCQVRRAGDGFELEKVGFSQIYPGGERPGDPALEHAARVQAVKQAIQRAGIKSKTSVSAVSGESIIVRYLQLQKMPEEELKNALQWEAEEYIPFRLDEVNIDSMVLGPNSYDPEKLDVLLVSAKKDLVEAHVSILREAGLQPGVVEVDSFAFLNAYDYNYGAENGDCVALVNIGAEITGICIYNKGVSRFSRDIPVGGNTMTEAIRSRLRCSYGEAESLKMTHGAGPPIDPHQDTTKSFSGTSLMDTIRGTVEEMASYSTKQALQSEGSTEDVVKRALGGVLGELITEVRRSIEFFENQIRDLNVSRIVLGGGSSQMANLRENFQSELSLPTDVIDPLRKVRPAAKGLDMTTVEAVRHGLAVGVGLGIRGVTG